MKTRFKLILLLLIQVFLFIQLAVAQGRLKGTITDNQTGEPLVGVTVKLVGEKSEAFLGTTTGLDGSFYLKNIPFGLYNLTADYISYQSHKQAVKIEDDVELRLSIQIGEATQTLSEVVITQTNRTEDEGGARLFEQRADQLTNIVSSRAIQISPDLTVANVVQRVSGISIERNSNGDGQYAIVRGMDKRYNYTLVNGVKIPSPDNKYRYVPLDIFPSDLLQRLEVYKSLTPSMEGDAIGGAINLVMRDAPDEFTFNINMASGVNQLFVSRPFTSFNKGAIEKKSPYERNAQGYNAKPTDFSSGLIEFHSPLPSNFVGGLALGNRFVGGKLGAILALSGQNTFRGARSLFFNIENVDTFRVPVLTKMLERNFSEQQQRYGIHNKLDFKINNRHKLTFYNAYMWFSNTQVRQTKVLELSFGYFPEQGNANLEYQWRSRRTIQQILTSTLHGEHRFGKIKADWSGVYAFAKSEQPENTNLEIFGDRRAFVDRMTTPKSMTRRWERNDDKDLSFYANFTYRENLGAGQLEIMAGGLYRDKTRTNFYNNYRFDPINSLDTLGKQIAEFNQIRWNVANPRGSVATALAYDATEQIAAGYSQFKYTLKKLQIITGARIENTNQGYKMRFPIGEGRPVGNQNYTDLLPSLHLKYSLTKNENIRASYFRAINRPGFFEIVPYRIVNEDFQERGNPDLKRAISDNFDLRFESFPKAGEQFMVGVFYKNIQNPIEFTLQRDPIRGQDIFEGPGNFGTATNFGLEIDAMKFINWFGIKANYTFTVSSITTPKSLRIRDNNGDLQTISVKQTRPLYGQSAHIANLTLIVKDVKNGFDAQITTNYTGERILTVSQFADADLWQVGFIQTDLSMEKQFKKRYTVFAKANNLLDTPLRVYVKGTNTKNNDVPRQDFGTNTLVRTDFYGQSYLIGLRFKLN